MWVGGVAKEGSCFFSLLGPHIPASRWGRWSLRQATFPVDSELLFFCMPDLSDRISVEYEGPSASPKEWGYSMCPSMSSAVPLTSAWASPVGEHLLFLGPGPPPGHSVDSSSGSPCLSFPTESCGSLGYSSPVDPVGSLGDI